jgi:5-formyltetrahydrofolate cyclo-ligase
MLSKAQIREDHKALRQSLSPSQRAALSAKIRARIMDWLGERPEIWHVHLFLPIERMGEVDTFPLFTQLKEKGYTVYTSALDQDGNRLFTLDITTVSQFEPDSWGIPQPLGAKSTSPDRIQLVLVPLLAYDRVGHRLGYGKGYYDGFLGSLSQPVFKVGLSFFEPVPAIPAEAHDVRLDFCVSPSKTHTFQA